MSTLKIIDKKKNDFKIFLLSGDKNFKEICSQITKYKPEVFIINNFHVFKKVKINLKRKIKLLNNFDDVIFKKEMTLL